MNKKLSFIEDEYILSAVDGIRRGFTWSETVDGQAYWEDVQKKLIGLVNHRTTDYQPLDQTKALTEEWLINFIIKHKRQPRVLVRDRPSEQWRTGRVLCFCHCDARASFPYIAVSSDGFVSAFAMCKLEDGEPAE